MVKGKHVSCFYSEVFLAYAWCNKNLTQMCLNVPVCMLENQYSMPSAGLYWMYNFLQIFYSPQISFFVCFLDAHVDF